MFYLQFTGLEERLSVEEEYIMQEAEKEEGKERHKGKLLHHSEQHFCYIKNKGWCIFET